MTAVSKQKLDAYYQLAKPGIIYGNALTAVAGYIFASKFHINLIKFLSMLIGSSLVIGSACVFNNYLDKSIDSKMARTKKRVLVTGYIKNKSALSYGAILGLVGFLILTLTNRLTFIIGLVSIIFYVIIYGFAKRRTVYGTLVGTVPGSASLLAGFTAYSDKINLTAILLFLIMLTWQMAHFYSISVYRVKDYIAAGIPLWSVKRGISSTTFQIRLFIILFIFANVLLGIHIKNLFYVLLMLLTGFYWLNVSLNLAKLDSVVWGKKTFLASLKVILVFSVVLSIARLL